MAIPAAPGGSAELPQGPCRWQTDHCVCGGLVYEGDAPAPEDTIECENEKCGRKGTYAEVTADCEAVYAQYQDWYLQRAALGGPTMKEIRTWEPKGKCKFTMKMVGWESSKPSNYDLCLEGEVAVGAGMTASLARSTGVSSHHFFAMKRMDISRP
jgi:hypothetical protein